MNKMAKGALAIGVGAALLLGGGGTLATWNATQNSSAGSIASGELKLEAGTGTWTSNMTAGTIRAADYKMVPGEKLSYTQDLTATLVGDRITANLTATGAVAKAFGNEANVTMEYFANGSWTPAASGATAIKLELPAGTHTIKARINVDFTNMAPNTVSSMMQTDALTGVGFKLEQNVPVTTAATQAPLAPKAP